MARSNITVAIYQTDNGFLVDAGCLRLAFTSVSLLLTELNRWMENSAAVEKEYSAKYMQPERVERERYNVETAAGIGTIGGLAGFATAEDRERLRGLDRIYPTKT